MTKHLTPKQSQVLEVVQNYLSSKGHAPSLGELQQELKISSKRGVVQYLEALERKGFLMRTSEARGLSLPAESSRRFVHVPIIGYANAGKPLVYSDPDLRGKLQIDRSLVPEGHNTFAVIVKGDSMDQKEINGIPLRDGQYAVIDPDSQVDEDSAVLAIIDECATIKCFHKEEHQVVLYPKSSNPIHRPIYVSTEHGSFINGRVVAVLSNPS